MAACGSELIATIHREEDIPARCCTAPEIPHAIYKSGETVLPVWPTWWEYSCQPLSTTGREAATAPPRTSARSSRILKLDQGLNISRIKERVSTEKINGEIDFEIKVSKKIHENNFNNFYKTGIHLIDKNKKVLLLSGALNPNTQVIKNFLSSIPRADVEHLYKINKDWNIALDNFNYKDYQLIVYDNFPSSADDFKIHSLIILNKFWKFWFILF